MRPRASSVRDAGHDVVAASCGDRARLKPFLVDTALSILRLAAGAARPALAIQARNLIHRGSSP
jgi:hypothetical protein